MREKDKGYIVFSNLMDAVFELAEELNDKDTAMVLTDKEYKLLETLDKYCEEALEQEEN